MRKYIIGFCAALLLIGTVAFMRQQNSGILITGGFGGEPKLQASQPDQTAPWILFDNFQVPANGILPITYGGTGTNTASGAFTALGFGTTVSVSMTNASNVFTGTFNGLDSGITNSSGYTIDTRATNAATGLAGNLGNTTVATMTNSANQFTGTLTNSAYYGNGVGLTNCSVTMLTNIPISAQLYTNQTTMSQTWRVPVIVIEPATTAGSAEVDAKVNGGSGATYYTIDNAAIQGGTTSILQTNKETLVFEVPIGWAWTVTNTVAGSGYTASLNANATNQVTFHP